VISGLLLAAATGCVVSVTPAGGDSKPAENNTPGPTASTSSPAPSQGDEVDYVACLTETAGGDASKVLSFYATVHRTAEDISVSLQPLKTAPATVSSAGVVGTAVQATSPLQSGGFTLNLGTLTVPGSANPISGSDLVIEGATLTGTLSCAHLGGSAGGDASALYPAKNVCKFLLVKDGDPTPAVTADTFKCN
jgi:hypothetical protein